MGASAGFTRGKTVPFRPMERRISMSYAMPANCQIWLRVTESQSVQGAQVSLLAALVLSAIHVRVIHRAWPAGSTGSPDEIAVTMPLVPANERLARPPRTIRGPAGGSWISLQLFNHERAALTEEHEIGACVDGIREAALPLVARVHPAAWLSVRGQHEGFDPMLRLDGELVFVSGIGMRLRMRPLVGAPEGGGILDIPLTSVGTTVHFADRLVERDLPGLPAIYLAFLDADGQPIGRERMAHVRDAS